jgi:heat shock protein HslJ
MSDRRVICMTGTAAGWRAAGLAIAIAVMSSSVVQPSNASPDTWRASGNEPSWSLSRADGQMTLETDFGAKRTSFATPPETRIDERTVAYSTSVEGTPLRLIIKSEICEDTMTGMPRPERVSVVLGDREFDGCGGEPASLLQGNDWVVTQLAGRAVLAEPIISVTFSKDGRLSGNASCNQFGADYRLTGEGLEISKGMSSMMACEDAVMQQERSFLEFLGAISRFSIPGDGALMLHSNDGRTVSMKKK